MKGGCISHSHRTAERLASLGDRQLNGLIANTRFARRMPTRCCDLLSHPTRRPGRDVPDVAMGQQQPREPEGPPPRSKHGHRAKLHLGTPQGQPGP